MIHHVCYALSHRLAIIPVTKKKVIRDNGQIALDGDNVMSVDLAMDNMPQVGSVYSSTGTNRS